MFPEVYNIQSLVYLVKLAPDKFLVKYLFLFWLATHNLKVSHYKFTCLNGFLVVLMFY